MEKEYTPPTPEGHCRIGLSMTREPSGPLDDQEASEQEVSREREE
jgi:hypothetical protein